MSYGETLLPEFDQEMANTRKVLERIPDDKLDWKPHPKSNTIGWNANHLADIPNWMALALTTDSLDIAPPDGPKYEFPALTSREAILELFDRNVAAARRRSPRSRTRTWASRGRCCRPARCSSPCRARPWSAGSASTT